MEAAQTIGVTGYHSTRFAPDPRRDVLWKTLVANYFQALIPANGCILELGAGYAHFINHVRAHRKIAIDLWEGLRAHVAPEVETMIQSVCDLSSIEPASIDFAFASNLVEHLTQPEFAALLQQLQQKLRPGGTLNLLQPNFRFAYREYFDDYTHVTVYSDRSLCDFLEAHGFRVIECRPRFLPLTVKSRWPVSPFLIQLYLLSPWKIMGKQMLLRCTPA
ncbi:MAG TPA: methyltransferase domain-containing protein [Bryobacteraceae bacterium]|nr:methyltransferase domain-containing protein [Bryobacteraceae bacterium]